MPRLLNTEMLSNPLNWFIITLVVLFAGLAVHHVSISAQGS